MAVNNNNNITTIYKAQ